VRRFAGGVATLILFALSAFPGRVLAKDLDDFARCLTRKQVVMYGSFYCSHCSDQKKMFGTSFEFVTYVECSIPGSRQMTFACTAAQIQFTPTWVFADGERHSGVMTLKDLSAKTGCPLP